MEVRYFSKYRVCRNLQFRYCFVKNEFLTLSNCLLSRNMSSTRLLLQQQRHSYKINIEIGNFLFFMNHHLKILDHYSKSKLNIIILPSTFLLDLSYLTYLTNLKSNGEIFIIEFIHFQVVPKAFWIVQIIHSAQYGCQSLHFTYSHDARLESVWNEATRIAHSGALYLEECSRGMTAGLYQCNRQIQRSL